MSKLHLRSPRRCGLEILEPRMVMTAVPILHSITRLPSADFQYNFRLLGSAEPRAVLTLEQTGRGVVGATVANDAGSWTININQAHVAHAKFEFRAIAADSAGRASTPSAPMLYRPNIVLINTDDMRADQVPFMPYIQSLASTATVFDNFVAPTSVSGPSRASLLTGLLSIHNGVLNNTVTTGTYLNLDDSSTLPVWLSGAGYETGLFGKDRTKPNVEGEYKSQDILAPRPGWNDYFAMIAKGTSPYAASFTDNGVQVDLSGNQHVIDVLAGKVLNFVERSAGSPFFAYFAPNYPHAPGTPAARHDHAYDGLLPQHGPNYLVQDLPPKSQEQLALWETYYREGTEALLTIDEAILSLVKSLAARHLLDNTVLLFTSDNGYMYGEHNALQKNLFWEESIRVPLIVWDGRHRVGQVAHGLAATMDITATIADLSGATPPSAIDGVSLATVLSNPATHPRESVLLIHQATNGSSVPYVDHLRTGVRTQDWVYERSTEGDRHMYDLTADPYQLNNLALRPEYADKVKQMDQLVDQLLGKDRQPPQVSVASLKTTGVNYTKPQPLRLLVEVNDIATGNSQIRTPAVFAPDKSFAFGHALDPFDGKFDRSRELAYIDLTMPELIESGLPIALMVAGRDLPGNISAPIAVPFTFDPAPRLRRADDTGDSSSDGVTLDSTPTFVGKAEPGQRIALFSVAVRQREAQLLGTATADGTGNWSVRATFAEPGYYTIYGQQADGVGAPVSRVSILKPSLYHLLAMNNGNLATVAGSPGDDQILVEIAPGAPGSWKYSLNGVGVGTLPATRSVSIIGDDGNDRLEVRGNIPSRMNGGNGDDVLIGGDASDVLIGWRGANKLYGGLRDDLYLYSFSQNQIRKGFSRPLLTDAVFEDLGAGTDRLEFVGDFSVTAKLGEDENEPHFILAPKGGLPGKIVINNPAAIERLVGLDKTSFSSMPSSTLVLSGAEDDSVELADAVAPAEFVDLRSLILNDVSSIQGFSHSKLIVRQAGFIEATDRLSISPRGDGPYEVNVTGNTVKVSGIAVGVLTVPLDNNPLTIVWYEVAKLQDVQLVLRRTQFRTHSRTPNTTSRVLGFILVDRFGGPSREVTRWLNFVP